MREAELTVRWEALSPEDYNMVVMLVDRLADKPSNVLRKVRERYVKQSPISMEEINDEIENYRSEKRGYFIM